MSENCVIMMFLKKLPILLQEGEENNKVRSILEVTQQVCVTCVERNLRKSSVVIVLRHQASQELYDLLPWPLSSPFFNFACS